jgi:hypothetical protein
MKTWSLMTLHALITYIAIRMPGTKPNEISPLSIITVSQISAKRTIMGAPAPLAHHSGASAATECV